jgi:hypothetical protein
MASVAFSVPFCRSIFRLLFSWGGELCLDSRISCCTETSILSEKFKNKTEQHNFYHVVTD